AAPASAGGPVALAPVSWSEAGREAFTLESTAAGLLVGDRLGLMVLDPGAAQPRRLIGPRLYQGIHLLVRSRFDPDRVLALGGRQAAWLALRDGRWEVAARWEPGLEARGLHQSGPGEVW